MSEYRRVKGTRDLLPPEAGVWAAVEETARRVFALYGYEEIRTPILEHTELFVRSVGEATDIVGKEMYTFADRKGRSLTLRPESTASVARAFVENGLQAWPLPVKLFYVGPQFRYERPQRGRYRQFHQIGAESIGDAAPAADADLLAMLARFLRDLGFSGLEVRLNTVGDAASRDRYRQALVSFLEPRRDRLSEESRRRLAANPLRILDSKDAGERELLAAAPQLADHLSAAAAEHFTGVRALLERLGVEYRVDPRLVRGLDYYTHTVFEIVSRQLGAQDALVGGGRYDDLVGALGGPTMPGIGFAIGQDRLLEVLPEAFRARVVRRPSVLVVPVGAVDPGEVLALCEELRAAGLAAEGEVGRSLRSALKRADRQGVRHVVVLGETELARGAVQLKDLQQGTQGEVPRQALAAALEEAR
ncbi:MAG TPA: histidine--tRNA ligase [Thermoanaerobaculia bacterium]|nr:histidine--tRNA ligase [Thermoanaerobaculia bacterium]